MIHLRERKFLGVFRENVDKLQSRLDSAELRTARILVHLTCTGLIFWGLCLHLPGDPPPFLLATQFSMTSFLSRRFLNVTSGLRL